VPPGRGREAREKRWAQWQHCPDCPGFLANWLKRMKILKKMLAKGKGFY
jgi:hypothetical protein